MTRWRGVGLGIAIVGCAAAVLAQQEAPSGEDATNQPTEYGIRFTPGMARAMAAEYVGHALVSRYQLEQAKVDETIEAVARRIMAMAHRLDDEGFGDTLERMVESVMEGQLEAGGGAWIQPKSGRALAEALRPAMPVFRDLVRGIAQDVRPKLAPRQQLKFGADLLAFTTALDAVEQTLDRWSRGDVRPGENPLEDSNQLKRDESGRSPAYKLAESQARQAVVKGEWGEWKKYVEDAKKFYGFDEAQAAGADSILRDCLDRAAEFTRNDEWRQRVERNQLWASLLQQLRVGSTHPVRHYLERQYGRMLDPIHQIGQDLKQRVDAIPTLAQRRSAEDRMLQALGATGFVERPAEAAEQSTQEAPAAAGGTGQATSTQPWPPEPVFDEKGSANQEPIGADTGP